MLSYTLRQMARLSTEHLTTPLARALQALSLRHQRLRNLISNRPHRVYYRCKHKASNQDQALMFHKTSTTTNTGLEMGLNILRSI